jgi:MFS family permease|tara:strand:+ start:1512 stop:1970 length:459 start_codon:yes stop_codon:yes gene_type:complete
MYSVCVLAMALVVKPVTMLSDRLGDRRMLLLPGLYGSALALSMQPMCETVIPYAALAVCGSLAGALTMPNVTPFILDHVRAEERADALAMRNVGQDGGTLVGAATMGLVASLAGVPVAMGATAALQAGAATLFLVLSVPKQEEVASAGKGGE